MSNKHGHWFAVFSRNGVHIGLWGDGKVAADILARDYPDGKVVELVELPAPSEGVKSLNVAELVERLRHPVFEVEPPGWPVLHRESALEVMKQAASALEAMAAQLVSHEPPPVSHNEDSVSPAIVEPPVKVEGVKPVAWRVSALWEEGVKWYYAEVPVTGAKPVYSQETVSALQQRIEWLERETAANAVAYRQETNEALRRAEAAEIKLADSSEDKRAVEMQLHAAEDRIKEFVGELVESTKTWEAMCEERRLRIEGLEKERDTLLRGIKLSTKQDAVLAQLVRAEAAEARLEEVEAETIERCADVVDAMVVEAATIDAGVIVAQTLNKTAAAIRKLGRG